MPEEQKRSTNPGRTNIEDAQEVRFGYRYELLIEATEVTVE
jgi:hypothetical protein